MISAPLFFRVIKRLLTLRQIIILFLTVASTALVPIVHTFIMQVFYEKLRFTFVLQKVDKVYANLIGLLVGIALMNCVHVLSTFFMYYSTKEIYNSVYLACFKKAYAASEEDEGYQDTQLFLLQQADNLILLIRMLFMLWLPAIFDILMLLIFCIRSGATMGFIISFFFLYNILGLGVVARFNYKSQCAFKQSERNHRLYVQDILQKHENNLVYDLWPMHLEKAQAYIKDASQQCATVLYNIAISELVVPLVNVLYFAYIIYYFTNTDSSLNKSIIFSIMLNSKKDLWKLTRQMLTLLDVINVMDLNVFIDFSNQTPKLSRHITHIGNVKQDGILVEFKGLTINPIYGLNILTGPSGSGKTSVLKSISHNHANSLMLCQEDAIYTDSIEKNITGILPMNREIYDNLITMFDKYFLLARVDNVTSDSLSGGEKRLISFLRFCYYLEYKASIGEKHLILLLDEPFNHLDAKSVRIACEYINSKSADYIMIMVDHGQHINSNISKTFAIK